MTSLPPFLPALDELLLDDPAWVYQPGAGGCAGIARLRVWSAVGGGHFAVVTESGEGVPVSGVQPYVYENLSMRYPGPFAMAELWPEGLGGPAHAYLTLLMPDGKADWLILWPTSQKSVYRELLESWWTVFGPEVLSV